MSPQRTTIDGQLSRLVGSGKVLRIKIWAPDGTVVSSDLATLRGRQFPIGDGPEQAAVVLSILKLGEALRLETVAEGIEEEGQAADLRGLGADLGQGYYFARPLSPDAISALVAAETGQPGVVVDHRVA